MAIFSPPLSRFVRSRSNLYTFVMRVGGEINGSGNLDENLEWDLGDTRTIESLRLFQHKFFINGDS